MPRTAVLVPWFREPSLVEAHVRVFRNGWCEQAARYAPAALAATLQQLRELERVSPPTLTHALVVLQPVNRPRLSERDRDWLWRTFGLPVFEQVIGTRGQLLATECDAHDGLHVEATGGDLILENAELNTNPCPCGRKSPRTTMEIPRRKAAQAGG